MSARHFPVTVVVRGDTGIPDRLVIEVLNEVLRNDGLGDRYEIQPLDPHQFVVSPAPAKAKRTPKRKR